MTDNQSTVASGQLEEVYVNHNATLPYGLTVDAVCQAIDDVYGVLYEFDYFLLGRGLERLDELLLGNSFSGLVSELVVKRLAVHSATLVRNEKVGGYPDLIPVNLYRSGSLLRADEGIEVKVSKQKGGWQGHNPEAGWLAVFRYITSAEMRGTEKAPSIEFVQVLVAELSESDWAFSGRVGPSRRTITASITATGMDKLRSSPVYQNPEFIVAPSKELKTKYLSIQEEFHKGRD